MMEPDFDCLEFDCLQYFKNGAEFQSFKLASTPNDDLMPEIYKAISLLACTEEYKAENHPEFQQLKNMLNKKLENFSFTEDMARKYSERPSYRNYLDCYMESRAKKKSLNCCIEEMKALTMKAILMKNHEEYTRRLDENLKLEGARKGNFLPRTYQIRTSQQEEETVSLFSTQAMSSPRKTSEELPLALPMKIPVSISPVKEMTFLTISGDAHFTSSRGVDLKIERGDLMTVRGNFMISSKETSSNGNTSIDRGHSTDDFMLTEQ